MRECVDCHKPAMRGRLNFRCPRCHERYRALVAKVCKGDMALLGKIWNQ